MKTFPKSWVVALTLLFVICGFTTQVSAEGKTGKAEANQSVDTGLSANTYFTDELGNRRQPTEEERVAMGKGYQKDLARVAGKNKGNPNIQQHTNGAVSATIGLSKMQFLTVQENPDGSRSYAHGKMDENGKVILPKASSLAEE
jgi:hypothetical protein